MEIPLFPAISPTVCFGQSPDELSAAWTRAPLDLKESDGRQTATVELVHPDSPFTRVTLEFENGVLEGVEFEPVESKAGTAIILRALDSKLGPSEYVHMGYPPRWIFGIGTMHWHHKGPVHALLTGPRSMWIFRAGERREAIASKRFRIRLAEQIQKDGHLRRGPDEY